MIEMILVKPKEIPRIIKVENFNGIMDAIGVKRNKDKTHSFETMLINDGKPPFEGVGIVAHDNDDGRKRRPNMLGIWGAFAIVGMQRLDETSEANPHAFTSLTPEQCRSIMRKLAMWSVLHGKV